MRAIVVQMNAAEVSRYRSPSLARRSGNQMRSYVLRPDRLSSHSPTGIRSSERQSRIREAYMIVAASLIFPIRPMSGKRRKSRLVDIECSPRSE
jgi:hypothetical protein